MGSPAKRKKKFNKVKTINTINRVLLKSKAVSYVAGDGVNNLYCLSKKEIIPVDRNLALGLSSQPFLWSVFIAVFCRDKDEPYMKSEIINSQEKYFQHELIEFLNKEHTQLIKSANTNHVIGAGWLASPEGRDFSEKEAFDIFEQLGGFNASIDLDGQLYRTQAPT